MRFLLLVCIGPDFDPPATVGAETEAWVAEVERRGMRLAGGVADPPSEAVTVGHSGGELVVMRGKRVEADEQIVGFDLFEADSMEEMIEVVARHPMATAGRIEIRAIAPDDAS